MFFIQNVGDGVIEAFVRFAWDLGMANLHGKLKGSSVTSHLVTNVEDSKTREPSCNQEMGLSSLHIRLW